MNNEQALKFSEKVHLLIHSVRLIDGYKPSMMDKKVSELVINAFSNECDECKQVLQKKNTPVTNDGFFDKMKGVFE